MLKCSKATGGSAVKVTFALPADQIDQPVSVLGDFNNWDPLANPLKKRSNGTRSAVVEVPVADGTWFCDPEADAVVHDEYQVVDSLLTV